MYNNIVPCDCPFAFRGCLSRICVYWLIEGEKVEKKDFWKLTHTAAVQTTTTIIHCAVHVGRSTIIIIITIIKVCWYSAADGNAMIYYSVCVAILLYTFFIGLACK